MMKRGFQASEQKFNTTAALFFRALVWKIYQCALLNLIYFRENNDYHTFLSWFREDAHENVIK